jgi:hypothetical protein
MFLFIINFGEGQKSGMGSVGRREVPDNPEKSASFMRRWCKSSTKDSKPFGEPAMVHVAPLFNSGKC